MNDQRISIEEIVARLDTVFTNLDKQRAQGLERLQLIQSVQNTALEREQQRLITKYGADHPRVQKITARLTYNQGLRKDLAREIDRSKITVPQFDPNTWQGHGLVLDKNGVGIKGLTVSFADSKGTWIQALGYACTNEQGYFSITYPAQTGQTPSIPDSQPIFLTVTDQNRRVLHRERTPRYVKIGQIDFWRIELTEDRGCETPPEPDTSSIPVKVLTIHAPGKLIANQAGSFTARVNGDATPPVASVWNFGDGATATGLTATHSYAKAGAYTVTFMASNDGGTDTKTVTVAVEAGSISTEPCPDVWIVQGRVTDETGQGIGGLIVSVYDKDLFFDDRLGETETDENGNYSLTYHTKDFRDLIESRPDLYLKIMDRARNILYTTEKAIQYELDRVEIINVTLAK